MFNSFKIKNFRGISEVKIDKLKAINLFVGDNGSCKTTILDALYILLNPNNAQLIAASNLFRNIDRIDSNFWRAYFNDFDTNKKIELEAQNEVLKKVNINPIYSSEKHVVDKANVQSSSEIEENINGFNIEFGVNKEKYSTKIELALQMPIPVRQNEAEFLLNMTPVMMQLKSQPDKNYTEKTVGNYFNSATIGNNNEIGAKFDAVNEKFGKKAIIDFLKEMGVSITDIELSSSRRLMVRDERFSRRISFNTYGDGILHSFNIFLSIMSGNDGVILIDEIENGLYWTKQKVLWRAINKIANEKGQQIFATTHSREMLKHLYEVAKEDGFVDKVNLFRLEKKNNNISIISYDREELEYALSGNIEVR
jgi:AAA15 family ATPase/GTPase